MSSWREVVVRHAEEVGAELPDAIVDELAEHLDDLERAAIEDGACPEDARRRALEALAESPLVILRRHAHRRLASDPFHARTAASELVARRSQGRFSMHTLRLAFHQLRRHPRFAALTVAVMGLAIGAATTVFSVVDSVLLEPLPFRAPDRLVALWDTNSEEGLAREPISPVNFMDYRELPVFSDAAAWWRPAVNLVDPGLEPVRVSTLEAGGNLFAVLGVRPQVGAGFPEDGPLFDPSQEVVVISDRLWRNRYGADPGLVGRQLELDGTAFTVLGVMPPGFHFPDDVDVWQRSDWDFTQHSRHAHFMEGIARLAPAATLESAQAAVDSVAARLGEEHVASNRGWGMRLVPLLDDQLGYYRPALLVLFGAVGLLLVIGVLNVASLLVTRALARDREIAVRVSLGASPRQLLTQLMAESAVLTSAGAALGVVASMAALPILKRFVPAEVPRLEAATVDLRALGVSLAVTAVVSLILGLAPAHLLLRRRIAADLRSGERGSSRGTRRIYSVLVVGEVALACALLVGSALLVRTVREMVETPLGVDAQEVLVTSIQLSRSALDPELGVPEQWRQLGEMHSRILEAIRRQPGVAAAGSTNFLPFEEGWRNPITIEGEPPPAKPEDAPQVQQISASEGYFETMGAELLAGRHLSSTDTADAPPVLVVNETFARRFWGDEPAVGRAVRIYTSGIGPLGVNLMTTPEDRHVGVPFEVVGVVGDVRNAPLGQRVEPAVYFSSRQFPFAEMTVAVDAVDRRAALAAVEQALRSVAPQVPVGTPATWGERLAERTAEPRLLMRVLSLFAAVAAILAGAGVYGLLSWSVAMRRRELAIRLVLGASPAGVGRLVVAQSTLLVLVGVATGIALVRFADTALAAVLYGVRPGDPAAMVSAAVLLITAAGLACAPAIVRAMRVAPAEGLRVE